MAADKRFVKVSGEGALTCSEIWVDTVTGVQYLFHCAGYAGGLTPLLDAEGKPLLYRERKDYSPEV